MCYSGFVPICIPNFVAIGSVVSRHPLFVSSLVDSLRDLHTTPNHLRPKVSVVRTRIKIDLRVYKLTILIYSLLLIILINY